MSSLSLIHQVATQEKVVAFTFDDGPHPLFTPQILDIFRQAEGKATFCMIGQEIEAFRDVASEVHRAGHELANHTYSHPDLTKLSLEEARHELQRGDEQIRQVTGLPVATFRPPYFAVNQDILMLAEELGYHAIGCVNGEAKDWEQPQPDVEYIIEHTRRVAAPGSIFIFHDGYGERTRTVEAVSVLVTQLAADGYRFVTVSELLALAL